MGRHFTFIADCCRNRQNQWTVSQSNRNVNKKMSCELFWLNNIIALRRNAIFCWFWFFQVVQKKTSGEVGNYIVVSWPVVYRIFVLKSIKIKSSVFKLQSKTSGTFFIGTQCILVNIQSAPAYHIDLLLEIMRTIIIFPALLSVWYFPSETFPWLPLLLAWTAAHARAISESKYKIHSYFILSEKKLFFLRRPITIFTSAALSH